MNHSPSVLRVFKDILSSNTGYDEKHDAEAHHPHYGGERAETTCSSRWCIVQGVVGGGGGGFRMMSPCHTQDKGVVCQSEGQI
jgi:hypothetical protein